MPGVPQCSHTIDKQWLYEYNVVLIANPHVKCDCEVKMCPKPKCDPLAIFVFQLSCGRINRGRCRGDFLHRKIYELCINCCVLLATQYYDHTHTHTHGQGADGDNTIHQQHVCLYCCVLLYCFIMPQYKAFISMEEENMFFLTHSLIFCNGNYQSQVTSF